MADYERHDLSDELWIKLEPLLTGKVGDWGAVAKDNRKFINAVFENRCSLARFTPKLWWMEKYTSSFLPLA